MIEILEQKDLRLYEYYVVRQNKLFLIDRRDVAVSERYCILGTTPSTPSDIVLHRGFRTADKDPFYAFDPMEFVVNANYYTPEGIRNFIMDIGEFKNWWK